MVESQRIATWRGRHWHQHYHSNPPDPRGRQSRQYQLLWSAVRLCSASGWQGTRRPQSFAFFPFAISLCCHFFYPPTSHSQLSSVPWYGLVLFRPESVGRQRFLDQNLDRVSKFGFMHFSAFEILNRRTEVTWCRPFPEPFPKPWKIGSIFHWSHSHEINYQLINYFVLSRTSCNHTKLAFWILYVFLDSVVCLLTLLPL